MGIDLISRLSTRFSNTGMISERPDVITRDIGGHFRKNHPYISGYFQIMVGLPQRLFDQVSTTSDVASKWLHSTCESFTPHSQTINKVDIQGQGQIGSSFVSSVITNREFSLAFREYQNLPILNIIKQWASVMDPFTGVSPLGGNEFLPENYKGWIAVAQTKPTRSQEGVLEASDIEECYIYQGVFPTNVPLDSINSDITANDTAQLAVTFSFDGSPLTSAEVGVTDQVVSLFAGFSPIATGQSPAGTYENYTTGGTATAQWMNNPSGTTDAKSINNG